jgi:hypothetical protein
VIIPALGCSFIIIGNFPHLRGGLYGEALMVLSLGVILALVIKVCPALSGFQGCCKVVAERTAQRNDI